MSQTELDCWQGADKCDTCHGTGFANLVGGGRIVCNVCNGNGHKTGVGRMNITKLYRKYADDLKNVRSMQKQIYPWIERIPKARVLARKLFNTPTPQLDDIEAEITYLLIRETKPETVVEISPKHGWSTTWILRALYDNDVGMCQSYDLHSRQPFVGKMPAKYSERWCMTTGDVTENEEAWWFDEPWIDYLFMDSNHTAEFAEWYIHTLFPMVKEKSIISVHDVHSLHSYRDGEDAVVMDWVEQNKKGYYTPHQEMREVMKIREELGFTELIHCMEINSMIWFRR